MKIFLWGFMGCGKSTLRNKLAFDGLDFDEELLRRFGEKNELMGEFIERLGWKDFREKEFQLYQEILKSKESGVYSLGGGCLIDSDKNWSFPNGKDQLLVWISTPVETCWQRVAQDSERPLVKSGEQAFHELYAEREKKYGLSHFQSSSEEEICQFVTDAMGQDL